jgi:hypothetical protein
VLAASLLLVPAGTGHADETRYRTLGDADQRQLDRMELVLQQPPDAVNLQQRTAAAAWLLDLKQHQAASVLNETMLTGNTPAILAILTAASEQDQPDPDLLPILLLSLRSAPSETLVPMGVALARYQPAEPATLATIVTQALDSTNTIEERIAALEALAAFRTQGNLAIEPVMMIMGRHASEPPSVVTTAMQTASSLTGMPDLQSPDAWSTWWLANRRRSTEERLQNVIAAMNRRIAILEVAVQQSSGEADRSSDRLLTTYRTLVPMLTLPQQQSKLLELLGDSRSDVRQFAVERMGVMLRDGHDTPELQTATISLLQDPDLDVRQRVAPLLGELDPAGLDGIVLERLENEHDPTILQHALSAIEVRPNIAAIPAVRQLLEHDIVRDQAARTLLAILQSDAELRSIDRGAIARAALAALDASDDPSIAAVLIMTGSPEDLRGLSALLDAEDAATRAIIADAFLRRGRRNVLISRADDEVIFPFAMKAATTNDADAVRRVLSLAPPNDELGTLWMDTVAELASETALDRILELDDEVGATPHASDLLRTRLLSGAIAERELDTELHRRILKRLVPMLLEQDAAASALTHIRGLDPESLDDDLIKLRFISAIRARLYDDAATMQPTTAAWILAYEDTLASRPESAPDLRDEIVRRFNADLTPELRAQLGLAQDPLMTPDEENPPADSTDEPEPTP